MNTSVVEPMPASITVNGTADGRGLSAVAWASVLAGAAGAVALSLILLILGAGLGLSSVSPWAHYGARAATIGVSAIGWLIFTQFAAAGLGGYLAGRLRTRWVGVHTDEVYFRDTAHGFLAWAVATFVTAALLTSTIGALLNRGVEAGAIVAGTAATAGAAAIASGSPGPDHDRADPTAYTVDSLFRVEAPAAPAAAPAGTMRGPAAGAPASVAPLDPNVRPEVARIFINSLRAGSMPATDTRYVGQLIAQRSGLAQAEAEQRVTVAFTRLEATLTKVEADAKSAADNARKAAAHTSLWLFISLLIGAFIASLSATLGGRLRDR